MFIKKALFAIVPVCMIATVGVADDDLFNELSTVSVDSISDADIAIEESFADIDVDALLDGTTADNDDAVEACFRRFGYRSYRHYGHYGYGYRYGCGYRTFRSCYTPSYYCYRPVYSYCPSYSYWGCY